MFNLFKSKRLIIVADDFGLHSDTNLAILKTLTQGFATTTSLMVYGPGTKEAIKLIHQHSIHNVGIHLTLQNINPSKKLLHTIDYKHIFQTYSDQIIHQSILKEIHYFTKLLGFQPTHINTHQGIHGNLKVLNTIIKYAQQHNIPIRVPRTSIDSSFENRNYTAEILLQRHRIRHPHYILAGINGADINIIKQHFLEKLSIVKKGETAEILFHPGYFTSRLLPLTSLTYERTRDLSLLLDKKFLYQIKQLGFKLINYQQL